MSFKSISYSSNGKNVNECKTPQRCVSLFDKFKASGFLSELTIRTKMTSLFHFDDVSNYFCDITKVVIFINAF